MKYALIKMFFFIAYLLMLYRMLLKTVTACGYIFEHKKNRFKSRSNTLNVCTFCMFVPILYTYLLYQMGQYFLDIQYIFHNKSFCSSYISIFSFIMISYLIVNFWGFGEFSYVLYCIGMCTRYTYLLCT